jgi:hypothetical protein
MLRPTIVVALVICTSTARAEPQDRLPVDAASVVTRHPGGPTVVRAVRVEAPLRVDGRLDEEVYSAIPAIGDFMQSLPTEGAPASERTDAWLFFDADYVYVSARCWDSAPPSQWVANELRRDTNQLRQNDTFSVMFDTFHDRRNGYVFYTNPLGARADFAYTDESNVNSDWNTVWNVRTGRFDGGWTVEMAIPFKSLRYRTGENQEWGVQFRRIIRRKNEIAYLTQIPISVGLGGISRSSEAATLVGLDVPPASKNLEIKPYAIASLTTDKTRTPAIVNDGEGAWGFDVKYGVTASLTADVTYKTDFAQVEIDEQQINLTRFNLLFPEKREFFLEGRGTMDFGRGVSGAPTSATADAPSLYYSRRIGLNGNRVVPVDVGARLTGKAGSYGIGLMHIQTGEDAASASPTTGFSVLRIKREVLRRSFIGAMVTNRSRSVTGSRSNQAYGADALFALFQNLGISGYVARTATEGLKGDDTSARASVDYTGDRYGMSVQHMHVGRNFNPEVGFVRRRDFRRSFASGRFSPRPMNIESVRRFSWEGSFDYVENGEGQLESRELIGRFSTEFENSDLLTVQASRQYELLVNPFRIAPAVTLPIGGYDFADMQASYTFGQQRRASGTLAVQLGQFYDGTIAGISYTGGRVSLLKPLSVEPTLTINRVRLPAGDFTTRLARARTDYAFSPLMFVSALLQYSSSDRAVSSNLRFRWEYQPGSEIFLVYTDERDTLQTLASRLRNRAFVVKVNRLVRF